MSSMQEDSTDDLVESFEINLSLVHLFHLNILKTHFHQYQQEEATKLLETIIYDDFSFEVYFQKNWKKLSLILFEYPNLKKKAVQW